MKKLWVAILSGLILSMPAMTCAAKNKNESYQKRMAWWAKDRFGMFIHWGIYSVPAHAEWYMNNGHIPRAKYAEYAKEFDPVDFNADQWVKLARDAGMKYLVITSKHHDGFCMFRTKATKYNVVDDTPWHKDPLEMLSKACRKYGVRFCVYYSIMDWHSPDQGAYDPNPEHPTYNPTHFKPGKKAAYIEYMKTQLKELVTQYHPGVIWFDGGWMEGWTKADGQMIYDYLRKLDPSIIVNNRAGVGDYETPEQYIPPNGIPGHYWETCMTINNDWGYNASDLDFKSPETLVRNLVDIVSKGGNYLLNVGPTAKGIIPKPEVDRLEAMGHWLKTNGKAIYGTGASPFTTQLPWGRCTSKKNRLYLEVFDWPKDGKLRIEGLASVPTKAILLDSNRDLSLQKSGASLTIDVPTICPDPICTVVQLNFKGQPVVYNPPKIEAEDNIFLDSLDLGITSLNQGIAIRYTTTGNPPTVESPEVSGPVQLTETTAISAALFKGNQRVSAPATGFFIKVNPLPASTVSDLDYGLTYNYFTGTWDSIPDFYEMTPVKHGTIENFLLPPGRSKDNFGVRYTGYLKVADTGVYSFYLTSDDGSKLYVNDSLIVNNDFQHGATEKKGVVALERGLHPIQVDYFQASGEDSLSVYFKPPSGERTILPANYLFSRK